ncbi:MAG: methyltransferase domain-containing protein [Thermodesulfobacteriota bacterium]|nr:methyltransferase domain-containing protein [Thermodesulfobacteriota bacterium]
MHEKLIEIICCPSCKGTLQLYKEVVDQGRIKTGSLRCGPCSAEYLIKEFVPRFVVADRYVDTFSFEWNKFHDVQIDILNNTDLSEQFFRKNTGWTRETLKGKLILDAGVGAGRYAEVVSRWGGEIVGVDLSYAVDAAYKNTGQRENVHIIQADLFNLPFKPDTFDLIYSIGVLHHTPDTRAAFNSIVPLLKKGGEMSIFVYHFGEYCYFSNIWRKITIRLPLRLVYYLSTIAIPLYYIHKIPMIGLALQFLLPTANWPNWRWRWLDTFDWYTPKYQNKHTYPEVFRWFKEKGFTEIEIFEYPICIRGKKG